MQWNRWKSDRWWTGKQSRTSTLTAVQRHFGWFLSESPALFSNQSPNSSRGKGKNESLPSTHIGRTRSSYSLSSLQHLSLTTDFEHCLQPNNLFLPCSHHSPPVLICGEQKCLVCKSCIVFPYGCLRTVELDKKKKKKGLWGQIGIPVAVQNKCAKPQWPHPLDGALSIKSDKPHPSGERGNHSPFSLAVLPSHATVSNSKSSVRTDG